MAHAVPVDRVDARHCWHGVNIVVMTQEGPKESSENTKEQGKAHGEAAKAELNPWISTLLAPIVIAIVGTYATSVYGTKQDELKKIEVVEKFLPYFTGQGRPFSDALAAGTVLIHLGYSDLATELMLGIGSKGEELPAAAAGSTPSHKRPFSEDVRYIAFFDEHAGSTVPRLCESAGREFGRNDDSEALLARLIPQSESARNVLLSVVGAHKTNATKARGALRALLVATKDGQFGNGGGFIRSWSQDGAPMALALRAVIEGSSVEPVLKVLAIESIARISRYSISINDKAAEPVLSTRSFVEQAMLRTVKSPHGARVAAIRGYINGSGYADGGVQFDKRARALLLSIAKANGDDDLTVRELAANAVRGWDDDAFVAMIKQTSDTERRIGILGVGSGCSFGKCKETVGNSQNDSRLDALLSTVKTADSALQQLIVQRLIDFSSEPRAVSALKSTATSAEEYDARFAAYEALARDTNPDSRRFILDSLSGKEGDRSTAFYVVVDNCSKEFDEPLRNGAGAEVDAEQRASMEEMLKDRRVKCRAGVPGMRPSVTLRPQNPRSIGRTDPPR